MMSEPNLARPLIGGKDDEGWRKLGETAGRLGTTRGWRLSQPKQHGPRAGDGTSS
ncbi:hypothetical protein [Oryza sativa Japonica Group]|uniref:Uncharacterized protein P0694A04.28 n=1 Tax=Oryza sativa subsp. japonica TaxID=39947 RepID=Q5SMZ6_ORYSJ|nr:hypothetical protein [Oryza sativa Japonica Group]